MKLLKVIIVTVLILAICWAGGIKAADYYGEAKYEQLRDINRQQASYIETLQDYQVGLIEYYSQLPPEIKVVTETVYVDKPVYQVAEIISEEQVKALVEKEAEIERWKGIADWRKELLTFELGDNLPYDLTVMIEQFWRFFFSQERVMSQR